MARIQDEKREKASALADLAKRLYTPRNVSAALLIGEGVLCAAIVCFVAYTEIDWDAYMRQIDTVLAGERDYAKIRGGTGPLVYPAGHVYAYAALHWLTDGGRDRVVAQVIFASVYLTTLALVLRIHTRCRTVPPYAFVLLCLSKRLHSIYLLRLFNDGLAMLPLYAAVALAIDHRWRAASVFISIALSIKMNILLFAPAFALTMLLDVGLTQTVWNGLLIGSSQVFLALPFLVVAPLSYLSRAFDFRRAFLYKWTVNWRFVAESSFSGPTFGRDLLAAHLGLLSVCIRRLVVLHEGILAVFKRAWRAPSRPASLGHARLQPQAIATALFTSNLVGVICARSLHYQFYAWYAHSIPFLAWQTPYPVPAKLAIWAAIEYAWNVYPSTSLSSVVLLAANVALLAGVLIGPQGYIRPADAARAKRQS